MHSAVPLFSLSWSCHFISQLCPMPVLTGQPWNFARLSEQILLFKPVFEQLWSGDTALTMLVFVFCKVYLENVNRIVHFIHHYWSFSFLQNCIHDMQSCPPFHIGHNLIFCAQLDCITLLHPWWNHESPPAMDILWLCHSQNWLLYFKEVGKS